MKKILILVAVFALLTTGASAQRGHDRVQHYRIQRGVQSGELSRIEKSRLNKDRMRYKHAKRMAMRDGRITRYERRKLNALRRYDSRRVYAMKHNSRTRRFQ
jgi:hypothetical protein